MSNMFNDLPVIELHCDGRQVVQGYSNLMGMALKGLRGKSMKNPMHDILTSLTRDVVWIPYNKWHHPGGTTETFLYT